MRCDEASAQLALAAQNESAELQQHFAECEACRGRRQREADLNRVLAQLEPVVPRPGFDTRFFARLADEPKRARRARYLPALWALLPLTAAAALFLLRPHPHARPSPAPSASLDQIALSRDLELVQNLDVLRNFDEVQDFQVLEQLDASELARVAEEPR
jgi:hypothetical protein